MTSTNIQKNDFIKQNCENCKKEICEFPLEWYEICPKARVFKDIKQSVVKER